MLSSDTHPHHPIHCNLFSAGGWFFLAPRTSKDFQYLGINPRTSTKFTYSTISNTVKAKGTELTISPKNNLKMSVLALLKEKA